MSTFVKKYIVSRIKTPLVLMSPTKYLHCSKFVKLSPNHKFDTVIEFKFNRYTLIVIAIVIILLILNYFFQYNKLGLERVNGRKDEERIKRLPQCIIIGARKCGTRALIDMLNLHPQVEKAPIEVHFFDRDDNYSKGLEWYKSFMPETTVNQITIEKSPSYFNTPEVPERIYGMNNSIKLLLIVREPVTRVISDYTQIYGHTSRNTSHQNINQHFTNLIFNHDKSININYKAIRISIYSRYLQRWLDLFSSSQIKVIDGDTLIQNPYKILKEVESFLGLSPFIREDNFQHNTTKGFYCWKKLNPSTNNSSSSSASSDLHCLNESKGRKHPEVNSNTIKKLREFYNNYNTKFYDMIGIDFGWPVS